MIAIISQMSEQELVSSMHITCLGGSADDHKHQQPGQATIQQQKI